MHHFAYVVAIPGLYDRVMARMAPGVPDTVFMDPATLTATFIRFSNAEVLAPNFGRDEVLHRLILNWIPREWVAHAYYYRYRFLRQHLATGDRFHVENTMANNERLDTLANRPEPEAY